MKRYLTLFIFIAACNQVVEKNKPVIESTLNSHAATKSLKIKDYKVEEYVDGPDSLYFFVKGHYSNDVSFSDTLKFAKTGDQVIISK